MKIFQAFKSGSQHVNKTKKYLFFAYAINFLLVIVIAYGLASTLEESIGKSASGETLLEDFDEFWFLNFSALAKGLAETFDPSVTGIGAVFNSLDTALSGSLFDVSPLIAGIGSLYLLIWIFLSGGFLSIYVHKFPHKSSEFTFFQSAAKFFPRIGVLSIISGILYVILFAYLFEFLTWVVDEISRETIDERTHFIYTMIKYFLLWILVLTINIIFDYSKILVVIRDSKNVLSVPVPALKIVFTNFFKTYGLYFLIGSFWIISIIIYWIIVPGAGQSSWITIFLAFLVGQIYIFSRIWIRCLFIASQSELCKYLEEKTI